FVESGVVDAVKARVCEGDLAMLEAMDWDASGAFETYRDAIDNCFSGDSVDAIVARLQDDGGTWAQAQLKTLSTKSPQTLKVAHRQLSEGLKLKSFEENMRMEFRIANHVVSRHDFQEGVRAVIVEKDNAPKWVPETLAGVTDEMLDEIFAPLGEGELDF